MASDKGWAKTYLIDPLTEPDPSDETGPGTHFRSTYAPASPSASRSSSSVSREMAGTPATSSSTGPFRKSLSPSHKGAEIRSRGFSKGSSKGYPTPPASASPRRSQFPPAYREEAFSAYADEPRRRSVSHGPHSSSPKRVAFGESGSRSRGSSLGERYPGDTSHQPLDMIRKHSKKAHRSPHLRKHHQPGTDVIDRLDNVNPVHGGTYAYHHEGPYDAALFVRNTNFESSPLAAVRRGNEEALKATPIENVMDSLKRHRPLDGVASVPPGYMDRFGRTYEYEEGTDMMRDLGGNYKRWPGVDYHPDDLKGKGEPSFSIDRALKEHKAHGDLMDGGLEMTTRPRGKSHSCVEETGTDSGARRRSEWGIDMRRSNSTGKKIGEGLRRRIGSLRRKVKA